jgi:hypothetical protein
VTPKVAVSHIEQMSKMPTDGHDAEWLHFMSSTLKMPGCYLPAVREVLAQGRWRRHVGAGQNPVGYVKTAAYREALKLGLGMDRLGEPRVPAKDQPRRPAPSRNRGDDLRFDQPETRVGRVHLSIPEEKWKEYEDHIDGLHASHYDAGTYTRTERGAWRQGGAGAGNDDYRENEVPQWLQLDDGSEDVDWHTVARYAARKPGMVQALAHALRLRATGVSRPRAVTMAKTKDEACEIEAAWKWLDRNWQARIVRLFRLDKPPMESATSSERDLCHTSQRGGSFLAPAEALKRTVLLEARRLRLSQHDFGVFAGGPSLQSSLHDCRNRSRPDAASPYRFVDPIGLRGDVSTYWDGSTLMLWRSGSPRAFALRADTLEQALQVARNDDEMAELFLGPANKMYTRRPIVYLLAPKSLDFSEVDENVPESRV